MTDLRAHQASTVCGILLLATYIWIVIRVWRPLSARQAMTIGLWWVGLTLAFEFLFMHYVAAVSWAKLLHEYNLFAGRIWVLVPIFVLLAPYLFYRLQKP